jgi:hypothetical protein
MEKPTTLLAAALVCVLLLAQRATAADCTASQREWCAISACSGCELHSGAPVCSSESSLEITAIDQVCVSPCLNNELHIMSIPAPPPPPSGHACAYYDALNTPHTAALVPRCAEVGDEASCESLAGVFEYHFGAAGSFCGSLPLNVTDEYSGGPALDGQTACCPGTMTMAVLDDGGGGGATLVCLEDDATYSGPHLNATTVAFDVGSGACASTPIAAAPTSAPTVAPSPAPSTSPTTSPPPVLITTALSLVPGVGLVGGANACAACLFVYSGGLPSVITAGCPAEPLGCFDHFDPASIGPTPPVTPPATVFNATLSLGVCRSGICEGVLNTTLLAANPSNEPCAVGYCQPRLSVEFFNPDLVENWPTETHHAGCVGPAACAGFPNVRDALRYIEASFSTVPRQPGDSCLLPDACAETAVCNASNVCVPRRSKHPVCEHVQCRRCSKRDGLCSSIFAPIGAHCVNACLSNETGLCNAAGDCVGTNEGSALCLRDILAVGSRVEIDEPCFNITCVQRPLSFSGTVPAVEDSHLPGQDEAGVKTIVAAYFPKPGSCVLTSVNIGGVCEDGDLCTLGDSCTIDGYCAPESDKRNLCEQLFCAPCNGSTGLCDMNAPMLFGQPCFSACGESGRRGGACPDGDPSLVGRCIPLPLDETICTLADDDVCRDVACLSFYDPYVLDNIVAPPNVGLQNVPGLLDVFDMPSCMITSKANGISCRSAQAAADVCILLETCTAGLCVINETVDCSAQFNESCVDPIASFCNNGTGICVSVSMPPGTPCDDGSACTSGDVCLALPPPPPGISFLPTCGGVPSVNCSQPANGCVFSPGICNPDDGVCFFTDLASQTPCDLVNSDNCTITGLCDGGGLCLPDPVVCPADGNPCTVAGCDAITGLCSNTPVVAGTTCSDGDSCTLADVCNGAGLCVGMADSCLLADGECRVANGVCGAVVAGACQFIDAPVGTACTLGTGGICAAGAVCVHDCSTLGDCGSWGDCVSTMPPVCACFGGFSGPICDVAPPILPTPPESPPSAISNALDTTRTVLIIVLVVIFLSTGVFAFVSVCFRIPDIIDMRIFY